MSAHIEHVIGTTDYAGVCVGCRWYGSIYRVSALESAPHYRADHDAREHDRSRHKIPRWFRPSVVVIDVPGFSDTEWTAPASQSRETDRG